MRSLLCFMRKKDWKLNKIDYLPSGILHSVIDEYYYLQTLASRIKNKEDQNIILAAAQRLLDKNYGEFKKQSKITNRFIENVNKNKINLSCSTSMQ